MANGESNAMAAASIFSNEAQWRGALRRKAWRQRSNGGANAAKMAESSWLKAKYSVIRKLKAWLK
jgi:hypothetical protein